MFGLWLVLIFSVHLWGAVQNEECVVYSWTSSFRIVGGGTEAEAGQFPFMAALGYGPRTDIEWSCGGTLISDRFVLTAAHCLHSIKLGDVRWVRLGDLDLNVTADDDAQPQDFSVVDVYPHPEYKRSSYYQDIALLKLDRKAIFDDYVQPACLHFNHSLSAMDRVVATGWGHLNHWGDKTTRLMEVNLRLINHENCSNSFRHQVGRRLMDGILDDMQICAGNTEGRDTCPGDSGGPLLVPLTNHIIGITSFGKPCAIGDTAGVYTRVFYYLSWIESVVRNKTAE